MIDPKLARAAAERERRARPVVDFWAVGIRSLMAEAQYNRRAREGANKRTRESR